MSASRRYSMPRCWRSDSPEHRRMASAPFTERQRSNVMGHRLSKIYTRTGDTGTTGLGDGQRVPKDSARVRLLGALDETNAWIGLLLTHMLPEVLRQELV